MSEYRSSRADLSGLTGSDLPSLTEPSHSSFSPWTVAQQKHDDTSIMNHYLGLIGQFLKSLDPSGLPAPDSFQDLVDHFLSDIFPAFPIFGRGWLRDSGDRISNDTPRSEMEEWLCLNVILTMTYYFRSIHAPGTHEDGFKANTHLRYSLAAIEMLSSTKPSVNTIQALLGIGVAVYEMIGPGPSSIFFAAAVRDSYRLSLHRLAKADEVMSTHDLELRRHVFWTAYSLHKNISMELDLPMAFDGEIELDLPQATFTDDTPLLQSVGGGISFDISRARMQLALLQGHIRRRIGGPQEVTIRRHENLLPHIDLMALELTRWRTSLPVQLDAVILVKHFQTSAVVQMMHLKSGYFHCLRVLHTAILESRSLRAANRDTPQSLTVATSSITERYIQCAREIVDSMAVLASIKLTRLQGLTNSLATAISVLTDENTGQRTHKVLAADFLRCRLLRKALGGNTHTC